MAAKTPPEEQLWSVSAPHFNAGFVPYTYYAPIIRYMAGWDFTKVAAYCKKKGWKLERCTDKAEGLLIYEKWRENELVV